MKRKTASRRKTAPVILWVRSSFTSCLAVTRDSCSGFSLLAAGFWLFLDLGFAMDTKIIFGAGLPPVGDAILKLIFLPLKKLLVRVLLSLLLLAIVIECQAQTPTVPPAADLAKTGLLNDISTNTWLYFSPGATIDIGQLPAFPYKKGTIKYTHFIPPVLINRKTEIGRAHV